MVDCPYMQRQGFLLVDRYLAQEKGTFLHGDPKKYKAEDLNPLNGKPFGELYKKTLQIEGLIARSYNLVVMWETEWLAKCKILGIDLAATSSNPDYGRQTVEQKRQYHREYRERNRTALNEARRNYYDKNRDRILAYQKDRRLAGSTSHTE